MQVEEMTSSFSYKISDLLKMKNLGELPHDKIEQTFREHDDVIRLDDSDDSPIICAKYFDDYYVFADAKPNLEEKLFVIMMAHKIPIKFVNSLSEKDFVTIVGSFYEQISEGFVWKDKIKDSQNPEKIIADVAMVSMIFDKKYLGFLKKWK